jgi:nitrite reductase (NADH) large subunit
MSAVLRDQTVVDAVPGKAPVIIVGTGPVGIRVAQEILARDPGRELVLFGDEPWHPYNRVRLSSLLAGDMQWEDLQNPLRTGALSNVVQHHNCAIASFDPARRTLLDREGREHHYSQLILAVGSRPHIPSIPGISQDGVYRFRDMTDVVALAARKVRSRDAIVLGGGLLGLEAARGLSRAGTRVTVIEHAQHLMAAQLDQEAGEVLAAQLERIGIRVLTGRAVQKINGDGKVRSVRVQDGELPCDTLVLATGIRPNIELARAAGVRVNRGIVVDDHCRTSAAFVYAVGECAEHRGQVYGMVNPGFEQAAVVAHRLTGEVVDYRGSRSVSRLKVLKQTVISIGDTQEADNPVWARYWHYRDPATGVYRKLILQRGRLTGAIAIGDWAEVNRIQEAVQTGRRLYPWQLWRFARSGMLWPDGAELGVRDWPADAIVCNCTGVTCGTLNAAIADGCTGVEALMARTGASTVCGSCRPLLAELTGAQSVPVETAGRRTLAANALLTVLLVLAFMFVPALLQVDSVSDPRYGLGTLWRDGFWKQVSGFTMLGLAVLGLGLSARKRLARITFGHFGVWRALHAALGAAAIVLLLLHTGLQTGERLNAWLLLDFLALSLIGAATAFAVTQTTWRPRVQRRLQQWLTQAHVYLAWPLPALLGFHVLSVYYF